ncbi:uncharacterized protein LOC130504009, partial [Raphanus sativus]|uniref:Uncharacterized protein LOC130504009 n=1 Tax=Raphanus sativus TaxID=3726 RepID=A0A9W3CSG1_RAPSA
MGDEEQSDWEQEEQFLSDEESGYEEDQWTDDCSSTDYDDDPDGGELEPEPPDPYQDNTSYIDWSREEADQRANHEGEMYQEETESQISLDEHNYHEEAENEQEVVYPEDGVDDNSDHEESYVEERPWCEIPYSEENHDETDSQVSLPYSEANREDGATSERDFAEEEENEAVRSDEEYEPRYIQYAGHHEGIEAYWKWEKDLDQWFELHQIEEEERPLIAEDTLTEYAYWWYDRDASWTEMKELLREEFVTTAESHKEYHFRHPDVFPKPRRLILAPMSTPEIMPKKNCGSKSWEITCNTSSSKENDDKVVQSKKKPKEKHVQPKAVPKKGTQAKQNLKMSSLHMIKPQANLQWFKGALQLPKKKTEARSPAPTKSEQQAEKQYTKQKLEQCKFSDPLKITSIICYRCHQEGHYAVACPSRSSVEILHLETPENAFKDNLVQLVPEMSISSVIHLSLPRDVDIGNEENFEKNCLESDILQTHVIINSRPTPITAPKPELILGEIVSRSKLLQGGGYDEDIKSEPTMEKEIRRKPVESMKLREAIEAGHDI